MARLLLYYWQQASTLGVRTAIENAMSNHAGLLQAPHDIVGPSGWPSAGLPVFRSPRLTLREVRPTDAPSLARWLKRGDTWQFTEALPKDALGFATFIGQVIEERRTGHSACLAIIPLGLRDAIGFILLRRLDQGYHAGRCGVALGEPFYATGLLRAAVEVTFDFAFRHIGFHRLEMRSLDPREGEVLRELGAVREGVLRGAWRALGRQVDGTLWSLLTDEWTSAKRDVIYEWRPALADEPSASDEPGPPEDAATSIDPPWGKSLPVLSGAGFTLREVVADDAPLLLRVLTPHEIREFLDPPPLTEEMFRRYIAWAIRERELGRAVCYAIVVGSDPAPVGLVQARQIDPKFLTAEWGCVVADACQGTGLQPKVTCLLLEFLFERVGVTRLEAQTTRQNLVALGSLRAAGGTREATLRRVALIEDQCVDQELWVILKEDWRRLGS